MLSFLSNKKELFSALLALTLVCFSLASCGVNVSTSGNNILSQGGSDSCSGTCTTGSGATQGLQVFVEPDAGDSVITSAIQGAQKSVWVEMYLLTDRKIIDALEEAAHNHIDVRVMLETHPYGGGSVSPTETLDRLQAAGVQTKSTNPTFALTHEKGMVIDNKTAFITTANYTLSALGSGSSTENREYGIIDTNQQDVQSVTDIFNADWNRSSVQLSDPNLVVSPINSRTTFESLIDSAHKSLQIEAEEMQDSAIEQALTKAAQRGVQVQVILPSSSSTSSESSGSDNNSQGIQTIKQGGAKVEEDPHLYMHAKIIVVDGQKAFVGSENISTASLEQNRELGILVSDQGILSTLQQTFQQDWQNSKAV
jgi:phosphatidylserine/phosphatidylglycerophosphate/cardiolipin synthase-like enzyme